jgi:hypothetical protein
MSVEVDPDRVGRIGAGLDERRAEVAVEDVEVKVLDEDRLAAELEVRVPSGITTPVRPSARRA